MAGLNLKNIRKSFGDKTVLSDITFELSQGELLVLLGPSGCGKSTLLRIVAGLESADAGEIHLFEKRIDGKLPKDRNVALVFQNYALYPHMTVEKNLAFPLTVAGVAKDEKQKRVREVVRILGLEDKLYQRPGSLSGGERQRVALGRAIIRRPSLFLLDEPLSNLDAELRNRMRREIVSIQRRLQRTMIYVTHDQTEALTMADRIALMNNGRIVQIGTPQELYDNPSSIFAASFIGQPPINTIKARIEGAVFLPFGIPVFDRELTGDLNELIIGIRPEAIEIRPDGEYQAKVNSCEYLGGHNVVRLDFKGSTLTTSRHLQKLSSGETVHFSISSRDFYYFCPQTGQRILTN